jgi:hypothetical protein
MGLTTSQRRAVTQTIATRYRRASKAEKGKILDGPAPATTPARHSVARRPRIVAPRPPRPVTYGPEVAAGLRFCSDLAPRLRRFGELEVSDDTAALLVAISPATIDRRLAADRGAMTLRGRSHTKPGSLLKDAIPIRTWTGPGGTTRCPGSWRSTWSATRAATPWGPRLHPHRKVRSPPAGRRTARHPTRPARHRTAARCQAAGFSASSLISGRPRRGRLADPVAPMPICCARPSPPGDRLRRAPRTAPRRARPARRGPTAEALAPFVEPTLGVAALPRTPDDGGAALSQVQQPQRGDELVQRHRQQPLGAARWSHPSNPRCRSAFICIARGAESDVVPARSARTDCAASQPIRNVRRQGRLRPRNERRKLAGQGARSDEPPGRP